MTSNQKRLLVVDDESAIRESLSLGLGDYGWDVTEAPTSGAALEFDTPFDIYLIDLSLPDHDGFELARLLGKRFGDVPIILLTGYMNSRIQEDAKSYNISVVMKKPFKFEELDRVLNSLCDNRRPN